MYISKNLEKNNKGSMIYTADFQFFGVGALFHQNNNTYT